jgi:hypothetical protein
MEIYPFKYKVKNGRCKTKREVKLKPPNKNNEYKSNTIFLIIFFTLYRYNERLAFQAKAIWVYELKVNMGKMYILAAESEIGTKCTYTTL